MEHILKILKEKVKLYVFLNNVFFNKSIKEKILQIVLNKSLNHIVSSVFVTPLFRLSKYVLIRIYNGLLVLKSFILKLIKKVIDIHNTFITIAFKALKTVFIYTFNSFKLVAFNSLKFVAVESTKFTIGIMSQVFKTILWWVIILTIALIVLYLIKYYTSDHIIYAQDFILQAKNFIIETRDRLLEAIRDVGKTVETSTEKMEKIVNALEARKQPLYITIVKNAILALVVCGIGYFIYLYISKYWGTIISGVIKQIIASLMQFPKPSPAPSSTPSPIPDSYSACYKYPKLNKNCRF